MWKNKKLWAILIAIIALVGAYFGYQSFQKEEKPNYTTGKVMKGTIQSNINATGTINPVRFVDISTNVPGRLEAVYVKENQVVQAGDIIATIDSRQMQATLDSALTTMNNAEKDMERYRTLLKEGAVSEQTFDNAFTAYEKARASYEQVRANLSDATITAPMSGTIIGVPLKAGQTISTGMSTQMIIATIADLSELEIYLTVDETDIGNITRGATVDFTVDAHPGKTFKGYVKDIALGNKGDMGKTSNSVVYYTVRVGVESGSAHHFFPTMTARAIIHGEEHKDVLTVPLAAVRTDKVGEYVYVMKGGKPQRTSVKTGITGEGMIEVVHGVAEGDEIIISGDISNTPKKATRTRI